MFFSHRMLIAFVLLLGSCSQLQTTEMSSPEVKGQDTGLQELGTTRPSEEDVSDPSDAAESRPAADIGIEDTAPPTYTMAQIGCADGSREGFLDISRFPFIAGCSGAWTVPGVHALIPSCKRQAGNTGLTPMGEGCNVSDLCAEGWHVCSGRSDVTSSNPKNLGGKTSVPEKEYDYVDPFACDGLLDGTQGPLFFATRATNLGNFNCSPDPIEKDWGNNDIAGCGNLGCPTQADTCGPLKWMSHNLCQGLQKKDSCLCMKAGELPDEHPQHERGDEDNVICLAGTPACDWCQNLNYWEAKMGTSYENNWTCQGLIDNEAQELIKKDPYTQGGVLCCHDTGISESI